MQEEVPSKLFSVWSEKEGPQNPHGVWSAALLWQMWEQLLHLYGAGSSSLGWLSARDRFVCMVEEDLMPVSERLGHSDDGGPWTTVQRGQGPLGQGEL